MPAADPTAPFLNTEIVKADCKIDGVSIFGKPALVAVELNDKGYNKVTGVSKPLASGAKRRAQSDIPAERVLNDIPV